MSADPQDCVPVVAVRDTVRGTDIGTVERIVRSTSFFSEEEVGVAVELVGERLRSGESSGYFFTFAEVFGDAVGYCCYGPAPCTTASYDLYWIAVHARLQGHGIGRRLLAEAEDRIRSSASRPGRRVYVETSSREQYAPTRRFYERAGYETAAVVDDFYDVGDHKIIYVKEV